MSISDMNWRTSSTLQLVKLIAAELYYSFKFFEYLFVDGERTNPSQRFAEVLSCCRHRHASRGIVESGVLGKVEYRCRIRQILANVVAERQNILVMNGPPKNDDSGKPREE